jgi:hypothetical protein
LGRAISLPFFRPFQAQQHVRRLQREHQGVPGQAQVAGVGPVTVEHGWHLALAAAAARSALAELGASLGGDLDLGHGAVSSSQRAMRVRSVADKRGERGSGDLV